MIELKEVLEYFRDLFPEWLAAALHPINTCQRLLSSASEQEKLRDSLKLLLTSFLIALVVQLPLYHIYGIEWSTVGFHLASFTYFTLVMILAGFAIQLGLRIFGIRSSFSDSAAIYVAFFMCYQPILSFLALPQSSWLLGFLAIAKHENLNLGQTVHLYFSRNDSSARTLNFVGIISILSSWLNIAVVCVGSALMAVTVAERYTVSRVKSFSACAFAEVFLVIPMLFVFALLSAFAEYMFIGPNLPTELTH